MVENQTDLPRVFEVGQKIGEKFTVEAILRNDFMSVVYRVRHEQQKQNTLACHVIQLPIAKNGKLSQVREKVQSYKDLNLKSYPLNRGMGKEAGIGYIICQEVEGATLTSHLEKRMQLGRPFKTKGICSLLIEMVQALESLKEYPTAPQTHGLLTSNTILIQTNAKPRVKISDLGLSILREDLVQNPELDPWVIGTMPEFRGESTPNDPDLYSLGAILFQMVQLLPFSKDWQASFPAGYHPESVVALIIQLIAQCTAQQTEMNLSTLKEALKELSLMAGDDEAVTQDLSHLGAQIREAGFSIETPAPFQANPQEENLPKEPTNPLPVFKTPYPWEQTSQQIINPVSHTPVSAATMIGAPIAADIQQFEAIAAKVTTPMPAVQSEKMKTPTPEISSAFDQALAYATANPVTEAIKSQSSQVSQVETKASQSSILEPITSHVIVGSKQDKASEKLAAMETFHGVEFMMEPEESVFSSSSAIDLGHLPGEAPVMPKIYTPPPPTAIKDPKRAKWLVTKKGIDYGPFNYDEVIKQLFNDEIDAQNEICDSETDHRASLAEFEDFQSVLSEWNEAKIEKDRIKKEAADRARKIKQIAMIAGAVVVLLVIAVAAIFGQTIYESTLPKPTKISLDTWISSEFFNQKVELISRLEETPAQRAERERIALEARAREQALQDAKAMAKEASEANREQEIDLDKANTGRSLSKAEFQRAVSTRGSRLIPCIEKEVEINPSQKKFVVEVTIQNTGKVLNARLTSGSQSGTRCVFKALQGLTVEPFDGGNYTGKIPFELE
jgi:hypothetical protein